MTELTKHLVEDTKRFVPLAHMLWYSAPTPLEISFSGFLAMVTLTNREIFGRELWLAAFLEALREEPYAQFRQVTRIYRRYHG